MGFFFQICEEPENATLWVNENIISIYQKKSVLSKVKTNKKKKSRKKVHIYPHINYISVRNIIKVAVSLRYKIRKIFKKKNAWVGW